MKLLLITSHFPSYDYPESSYATPFLFNYAREWVKNGHEVHVIHFSRHYPKGFNFIANTMHKMGYTKLKKYVINPEVQADKEYEYDGVIIHRIGFLKTIPHGFASDRTVSYLYEKVNKIIIDGGSMPDLIVGDCVDPVINVVDKVRRNKQIKYCQILHDSDFVALENKKIAEIAKQADCFLLRSKKQYSRAKEILGEQTYEYMFSGIPEAVIDKELKPRSSIKELIFVGALYRSKGIDTILRGLKNAKTKDYHLKILGDGVDAEYFKRKVLELELANQVEFIGKVPHDDVFKYLRKSDMLLLLSVETFGMVYIEAMSQGCIPVGAKGEGIDGVVIDGENGYLLDLGDYVGLARLLDSLPQYSEEKIKTISLNAYKTAYEMTDNKLAEDLLDRIK